MIKQVYSQAKYALFVLFIVLVAGTAAVFMGEKSIGFYQKWQGVSFGLFLLKLILVIGLVVFRKKMIGVVSEKLKYNAAQTVLLSRGVWYLVLVFLVVETTRWVAW